MHRPSIRADWVVPVDGIVRSTTTHFGPNPYRVSDDRQPNTRPDQRDVVERVLKGEYDARAVSQTTLDRMKEDGSLLRDSVRVFWSSPGYSHCCFTAHSDLDNELSNKITRAFVSMDYADPVGKIAMDARGCKAFLPGITEGWETLEMVAKEQGLIE